ncbi:iron ABC transporter permease [Pontibacter sp. G13]|uniref:FecCD family ABC transporter permease n=1 Tax=Pontibacter sp. G13 TaxID=3074898 RepID=UPI00288AF513|nr:iron ABC transporter permease [Pontibacter sp. G13]WNJ17413.1 iron ABC transporter permease [Pontibacter sp. G13]
MRSRRYGIGICLLLVALIASGWLGINTGTMNFSAGEIWDALLGRDFTYANIIRDLRVPRTLLAMITGAVLSLGGFYMQALIKNPLADPYIMGVTAGAGFGVNLLILGLVPLVSITWFTYPLFAGIGGIASLMLVAVLGFRSFFEDNAKLLIAGVAVSSIFTALTGVLIYKFADSDQIRQMVFWSFGSFNKASWESVYVSGLMLLAGWIYGITQARRLDVLVLGDLQAQTLGMRVQRVKLGLLLITSLTVGGTVAFTGPIGFVGMMIPHFSRSLFGPLHVPNLILGALLGAVYLNGCDLISRWILPPAGLPIGVVTAILGVPFFLYLLFSKKSHL